MGKGDNPVVLLVIVLILVFYAWWSIKQNPDSNSVVDTNQTINSVKNTSNDNVSTKNSTVPLSYAQALTQYKDARIQIDQDCQARPNNVTYKNNTSIMIDNRTNITRTVKVGSIFSVKAYGFKIVKLSSTTLPIIWHVDCDKSQNVATILIQK